VQVLDWFVVVEGTAYFGRSAFAVVRRCPISHVVGVLAIAVIKHGVIRPQIGGRHVGNDARCF